MKPKPPTHMMTPKKKSSVSHSARDTSRKLSNAWMSPASLPRPILTMFVVWFR